ncbi:hypothetical protein ACWEOE_38405 [Amycolatopsis sp. NPDC004368]
MTAEPAVEEVNATIGAALSTCTLPAADEAVLLDLQHELLELTDALAAGAAVPELPRLWRAARELGPVVVPRGFEVLGGPSAAAGLLNLARRRPAGRRAKPRPTWSRCWAGWVMCCWRSRCAPRSGSGRSGSRDRVPTSVVIPTKRSY